MSLGEVNAMDRAGFWRIADAALETAFAGHTFDEAIRDAERFTHLGYWSDGRKVIPPLMTDNVSTLPRVDLPNGIRLIPWDSPARLGDAPRPRPIRGSGKPRRSGPMAKLGGATGQRDQRASQAASSSQVLRIAPSCAS